MVLGCILIILAAVAAIVACFKHYNEHLSGWELPAGIAAAAVGIIALGFLIGVLNVLLFGLATAIGFAYREWRRHHDPVARRTILACGSALIFLAAVKLALMNRASLKQPRTDVKAVMTDRYQDAKRTFFHLGRYLDSRARRCRVLVLLEPHMKDNVRQVSTIETYLPRGGGPGVTVSGTVFVRPPLTEATLHSLARNHTGCNVIVSLVGLPVDLDPGSREQHADEQAAMRPALVAFVTHDRISKTAADALRNGSLAAAILDRDSGSGAETPPNGTLPFAEQARVHFENRFVILDPLTLDAILEQHPELIRTEE